MNRICVLISLFLLSSCGDDGAELRYCKKDSAYYISEGRADNASGIYIEKNVLNLPVVAVLLGSAGDRYYIDEAYIDSIRAAGLYPMFVPYSDVGARLRQINPVAIMAVGGAFGDFHKVSAEWHNEEASPADMRRAHAYQVVIDYAKNYGLPYLGICAGAQELGIFLGGRLSSGINIGAPKVFHNDGNIHSIKIQPKSALYKIVGEREIDANSYHNSVIDSGIGEFSVSAVSNDGRIEAIEPIVPWNEFVLGVQWHPEKNAADCAVENPDCKIFKAFADAARKYAKDGGRQQVRVVVPDANDSHAVIELYHNNQLLKTFPGFVGEAGATTLKSEGDMKTPIGVFNIKRAFGADSGIDAKVPYQVMTDQDIWCDDSKSKFYNTLQKRGVPGCKSFEEMNIGAYKYGFVIEYNTDSPKRGFGSAIFMHVGDRPTAGCVAVSEDAMREILEWLDPKFSPHIKIISPNDDGFYISHVPDNPSLRALRIKYRDERGRVKADSIFVPAGDAKSALEGARKLLREKGAGIRMSQPTTKEAELE
ncbi:MAG: gamma-glutamyl-gamma-aminobutyrate hydrolase family protein [Rickettsiales bacterium]|jgi:L,D-peptidoglycan transpeptidase YkuD (ErfK/YbiS/YcfS/YnhG family)/anthranilate/para-aminobenzoate synthase component II|nr:gamma-glutamyl-gamma-aminobutyrate hydrolase family protein [Rickettsiales bacterium]